MKKDVFLRSPEKFIGDYERILVGSSSNELIRKNGTSGGVASQIICNLFEDNKIDKAIVVDTHGTKSFFRIVSNADEVLSCQGSKYIYLEVPDLIEKAKSLEEAGCKYAITALPCHSKVLRNLKEKGTLSNLKMIVGLFCGFCLDSSATQYILKANNIKDSDVVELKYRHGEYPGGLYIRTADNKLFFKKHYYDFLNLAFRREGCENCKDYMAEKSDISCGDAWGYDNSTVIISRTSVARDFLKKNIKIKEISPKVLLKMHGHNIKYKKEELGLFVKIISFGIKKTINIIPFKVFGFFTFVRRKILNWIK